MNCTLTRLCGNDLTTKGKLTISQTNFAALTLEAKDPHYTKTCNKALQALPDGIYRLKLFYWRTGYTLRFSLSGTYCKAQFEQGSEPEDVASGSIILGTEFDGDFKIKGSQKAMTMFGQFLELLLSQQCVGKNNNDITLTIQHSPDYIYNTLTQPATESLDIVNGDWNMVESNDNV